MKYKTSEIIVEEMKKIGVNFFTTLPCENAKNLLELIPKHFREVSLTREDEGVGICAGASLVGAKPAMLVQSSGIGNMINALCSLTKVYKLPLLILVSWRGIYNEKIPAQIPLGKNLPKILNSINISYSIIEDREDIFKIKEYLVNTYKNNNIHAVLLNPKIWSFEKNIANKEIVRINRKKYAIRQEKNLKPILTRLEVIKAISSYINGKIVICNLGNPCKELYSVNHQKSNFYMLGSMGLASSIGLGISLFAKKEVVVIEGDGSLLMNLGALSNIAKIKPPNLTILAIDNNVHGSTGNQPTNTQFCVDLQRTATGLGIKNTYKVATQKEISLLLQNLKKGPNFIHILAKPGNANVPNVPLTPFQIRKNVMEALKW